MEKQESENFSKRIQLSNQEAQHFGLAFGAAWRAANL